jgi:hypothetical protein
MGPFVAKGRVPQKSMEIPLLPCNRFETYDALNGRLSEKPLLELNGDTQTTYHLQPRRSEDFPTWQKTRKMVCLKHSSKSQ